jgi:hypothetical protein
MNKEVLGVALVLITAIAGGFWFYKDFDIFLISESKDIGSEIDESLISEDKNVGDKVDESLTESDEEDSSF